MRGNHDVLVGPAPVVGSIPACAGEPSWRRFAAKIIAVYPRVCGGTASTKAAIAQDVGLSPRVRGNHFEHESRRGIYRSIPACAGEPQYPQPLRWRRPVYPRVCGGTDTEEWVAWQANGLSPRVRGNHTAGYRRSHGTGSIPACAGEPHARQQKSPPSPVYPRVCGGTVGAPAPLIMVIGLSPRVRGNRIVAAVSVDGVGSIPACAGEPGRCPMSRTRGWVFPRVCGGTLRLPQWPRWTAGLSPRVRGNRRLVYGPTIYPGSIPACAGEPARRVGGCRRSAVYPRVCGGTSAPRGSQRQRRGLSPRVRGNRHGLAQGRQRLRSIPACAGEPQRQPVPSGDVRVYPRVCGGTCPWR